MNKSLINVCAILMALLLLGCAPEEQLSISLESPAVELFVGDELQLHAKLVHSNRDQIPLVWSSSNEEVASVRGGLIIAKKAGSATILVTADHATARCQVTVRNVELTGIALNTTAVTLKIGDKYALSASLTPSNVTNRTVVWASSNPRVVSVDDHGGLIALTEGEADITATSGSKSAACKVIVEIIEVEEISVTPTSLDLTEGDTYTLSATVLPENATNKAITWTSGDSSIVQVDADGKVSALKAGVVTISAKAGAKTATCEVNVAQKVIEVTGISLDKSTLSLVEEESTTLFATVIPSIATDKTVTWSSSSTSVTTVSSSGVVTAVKAGTATIIAMAGTKTATCKVTVSAKVIEVSGITLDRTSLSMTEGETYTLAATVSPSNATDKTVTWSSSNTSVATVSSSGVVAAKSVGSATITAKAGSITASCNITVNAKYVAVESITLSETSLLLDIDESYILKATVTPSDATDNTVTWLTSNQYVAKVTSYGLVSAVASGRATITAKAGDKSATCEVVVGKKVTGITLDKTSIAMKEGETMTLTATVSPSDAANKMVIWGSSNYSVAMVDSFGEVTAKATGTATITAKAGSFIASCKVTVNPATVSVTSVSLNKTNLSLTIGGSETLIATIQPSDATNKSVTWSSNNTSVATVSSSGLVTAKAAGTATITVKTVDGSKTATCSVTVQSNQQTINGHVYVEMGDGLKWATMNVGATKPEEYGDYFAWGETTTKTIFDWDTYKYGTSETSLTKYVKYSDYGTVDDKRTLDRSDDAARVHWGGTWRMPTDDEWTWLRTRCSWKWTSNYEGTGIAGFIVTSKVSGYTGSSIFLPAAGYRYWTNVYSEGSLGYYWSSTLSPMGSYGACDVYFISDNIYRSFFNRCNGLSVRPVSN